MSTTDTTSQLATERRAIFRRFAEMGEEQVRDTLATDGWSERRAEWAKEWLALRDTYPASQAIKDNAAAVKVANRIAMAGLAVATLALFLTALAWWFPRDGERQTRGQAVPSLAAPVAPVL